MLDATLGCMELMSLLLRKLQEDCLMASFHEGSAYRDLKYITCMI